MSGLGDLFGEAEIRAVNSAGGSRLAAESLDEVRGRVRRTHARRAAFRTGLVAVAVVVLGVGTLYGVNRLGPAPAADGGGPTGAASDTPSPSPSASPSPSETGFAWPGFVGSLTTDPHVPDASVITRDVWASTGPGWALVSYRETWVKDGADDRGPQVIYLVSPAGDRYELVNVPGDTVSVLAWAAGSPTAAVSVQPDGDAPYFAMLDLVTGELTKRDGYAPYIWSLAFLDADGAPVWTGNDGTSAYVSIASDGSQSAYEIPAVAGAVDFATSPDGGFDCAPAAPFDETTVLLSCTFEDSAMPSGVMSVDASAGEKVNLYGMGEGDGMALNPTRAGSYVVARTAPELAECPSEYSVISADGAVPVPGSEAGSLGAISTPVPFGAVGNQLVWALSNECYSTPQPMVVVRSDLAAGTYSVLMPYPKDRPAGEEPMQSVTGVAVAQ